MSNKSKKCAFKQNDKKKCNIKNVVEKKSSISDSNKKSASDINRKTKGDNSCCTTMKNENIKHGPAPATENSLPDEIDNKIVNLNPEENPNPLNKIFQNGLVNKNSIIEMLLEKLAGHSNRPVDPPLREISYDSDESDEFAEFVFSPRRYFNCSICQLCKNDFGLGLVACKNCSMTFYCNHDHMIQDEEHSKLCSILAQLSTQRGGHIYNNTKELTTDEFRALRIMTMNKCQHMLNRELLPFEREIILFPKICWCCREWKTKCLQDCLMCGQFTSCKNFSQHNLLSHKKWCESFIFLKKIISFQEQFGKIETRLPSKVFESSSRCKTSMDDLLRSLYDDNSFKDILEYTEITQIASGPLTVWYSLRLAQITDSCKLNMHIIGAEMQFEADVIQKWELFLMHLAPKLVELNITFVGPELFPPGIPMDSFTNHRMCKNCKIKKRTVNFHFENLLYHEYCNKNSFAAPDLVCFFNPGLHRETGFQNLDTWPLTIKAACNSNCPVLVTSYTQYESPLDLKRILHESNRRLNIVLPPSINPFSSSRPERNFISDDVAPLIFKNYFCFIVQ